jgi:hypothetical protein
MTGSVAQVGSGERRASEMHEPPTFELRLTTPNGEQLQVGPVATPAEVSALAYAYLGDGRAIRVEVYGRRRGRWRLLDVIGRTTPQSRPTSTPEEEEH